MIFYLTGTGNSLYAARTIAEHTHDELISIPAAINSDRKFYEYTLRDDEAIGFVFPVYAWGPPRMVLDFIKKLKLHNYRSNYVFALATCGGSIGNSMRVMDRHLRKKGMTLSSGFSVIMPNNYIVGMDVDSKEEANEMLAAAERTLAAIKQAVERRAAGEFKVVTGKYPRLLTAVVNPLFTNFAAHPSRFYADDNCTGCGICEKVCNCNNIKVDRGPKWGKRCIQCFACVHYCPVRAVQYGKGTVKKGRYTNPNVTVADIVKYRESGGQSGNR